MRLTVIGVENTLPSEGPDECRSFLRACLVNHTLRLGVSLWFALAVAITIKVLVTSSGHSLYSTFELGARNWWSRLPVYGEGWFRYSPTFALLVSPFAALPTKLGNVLWNLLNVGVMLLAVRQLVRYLLPGDWSYRREGLLLSLCLIATIRPVWSSQSHPLTAAMVFLATAAIVRQYWWRAAFFFSLAIYIKLAPVAIAMLFVGLYPKRFGVPLLCMMVAFALMPFLTAPPEYVLTQYQGWYEHITGTHARRWSSFRDAWMLWELTGTAVHLTAYRVLQTTAGLGIAGWCLLQHRRGHSLASLATLTLSMGGAYILVFGPAVEFVQYVILGPLLGWAVLDCFSRRVDRPIISLLFVAIMVCGAGAVERSLERILGTHAVIGISTLGVLCFMVWLDRHALRMRAVSSEESVFDSSTGERLPQPVLRKAA